jgi:hypothetical protein
VEEKAIYQIYHLEAQIKEDADQLLELIYKLYSYILDNYEELGGSEDMKELLPGAMELPLDKYRKQIDELTQEKEEAQKQVENLVKKDKLTEILLEQNRLDELMKSREDESFYQELLNEFQL